MVYFSFFTLRFSVRLSDRSLQNGRANGKSRYRLTKMTSLCLPTAYVVRDGRLYFQFVSLSTPGGYPIPGRGYPARSRWGRGYPLSSLGRGYPAKSRWGGVPRPGPDGGVPQPGPDRGDSGIPHCPEMGVPPYRTTDGLLATARSQSTVPLSTTHLG